MESMSYVLRIIRVIGQNMLVNFVVCAGQPYQTCPIMKNPAREGSGFFSAIDGPTHGRQHASAGV